MAVAELLTEIADEKYAGMGDKEIAAALNEVQTQYPTCPTSALQKKFAEVALGGKMIVARDKKLVDDELWARWLELSKVVALDNAGVFFNDPATPFEAFFVEIDKLGIIQAPQTTWLLDLGRVQRTIARQIFKDDVDQSTIQDARAWQDFNDKKLKPRRESIEAEYLKNLQQWQAASNEMNKVEGGKITGDPSYVPEWEKASAEVLTAGK